MFLLQKTFTSYGFPNCWFWVYMMKVIPETHYAHQITCRSFYCVNFFQIYQDKHHIGDKLHIFFCDIYLIVSKLNVWGVMVFNATFNNFSVISWRSVLLVEETGCLEKTTDSLHVTDKFITWCCIEYISHEWDSNNVIGSDSIGSCTSNYHTITRPYFCVEEK